MLGEGKEHSTLSQKCIILIQQVRQQVNLYVMYVVMMIIYSCTIERIRD